MHKSLREEDGNVNHSNYFQRFRVYLIMTDTSEPVTVKRKEKPNGQSNSTNPNEANKKTELARMSRLGLPVANKTVDTEDKKLHREKRFPEVINPISEDKKSARLERFGTQAATEVDKKQLREKRFIESTETEVVLQKRKGSETVDVQVKKKQRLERFGEESFLSDRELKIKTRLNRFADKSEPMGEAAVNRRKERFATEVEEDEVHNLLP